MDTPVGRVQRQQPLERFKPTTGMFVGISGLVLALGLVVYVAVYEHSSVGLRMVAAALFGAVVIWVTQLRPRVTAYPGVLVMQGSIRDSYLPLAAIDEVVMGQTLNVYVDRKRYVCVGIGKSLGYDVRQRVRAQGGGGGLFGSRAYQFTGRPEKGGKESKASYHAFVLDRITDLVSEAKSSPDADLHAEVTNRYAIPEIAALVVTAVALVATFLA